jgi:hypothetical protein
MRFSRSLQVILILACGTAACQPNPTQVILSPTQVLAPSPESTSTLSLAPVPPTVESTLPPPPRTFTEEFDGSLPYWAFLQIDNGRPFEGPSVQAGSLVFDLPASDQWAYALYARQDYTDIRLDARIDVQAGNDGAVGLVCRYSETAGWYEFNIYADQTYSLLFGQWLTQGVARFTPIFKDSSNKIQNGMNELGLLCQGDILTPSINGASMKQTLVTRVGLKRGTIGISAASFQSVPFTAAFNWVKVSLP